VPTVHFSIDQAAAQITYDNYSWSATIGASYGPLTFGFRSSAPTYNDSTSNPQGTFSMFSATEMAAAEQAIKAWAADAHVTFTEVNAGGYTNSAAILFGNYHSTTDGAQAFAYYPGSTSSLSAAGDVWLNTAYESTTYLPFGSYDYLALMHELGHTLGLEHPGNYNAGPGQTITYANSAQYVEDTQQYTIMSYFDASNTGANHVYQGIHYYASTPLLDDIAALQRLYGPSMTTRTGDTVYGFHNNTGDSAYDFSTTTERVLAIWDAGGNDTIDCTGFSNAQRIDLNAGSFSDIGHLTLNVAIAENCVIENAIGGSGNDSITGNATDNRLNGGTGADTLIGGKGNDTYVVDNVGDVVTENAGEGTDTVQTTLANYTLLANVESLIFTDSTSHIGNGNVLANVMTSGAGNDTFFGGAGNDTLIGGDGNDVLVGKADPFAVGEVDQLIGGNGDDTLYADVSSVISGGAGHDVLYMVNDLPANIDLAAASIEYVRAGFGDDVLNAAAATVTTEMYGGGGNDTLTGGSVTDWLWGQSGNDTLVGNDGNDILIGDVGADYLSGGAGNDRIYADSTDTFIDGGSGFDVLYMTDGVTVNLALDTMHIEWVQTLGGDDTITVPTSTTGIEVYAGGGNDTITGGSGVDRLWGEAGSDTLIGNGGNDVLVGGLGMDVLTGGSGNDLFVFNRGEANGDTIADFDGNGDIDLLMFAGYGTSSQGATFTQVDATHWRVNSSDGLLHDIIAFSNGAVIHPSDYLFV
jgi:serralysin